MAFADLLTQDGVGFVWLLEVSSDNFSTVAHRWATHACHVDSDRYDPRIVKLGKLSKAFGLDGFPSVGTVSLVLDNTAFDMDWLVDVSQGAIEFTYRFRLSLGLYSLPISSVGVDADIPSAQVQVMGTFGMLDSPQRDNVSVTLQLADDSMGRFNEFASSPTINEWRTDVSTDANNNLLVSSPNQLEPLVSWDQPLPLVFAPSAAGMLASLQGGDNGGTLAASGYTHAIVVCVTTSVDDVTADDVSALSATFRSDALCGDSGGNSGPFLGAGQSFAIPQTVTVAADDQGVKLGKATAGTYNVWAAQKCPAISKDGHAWRILWLALNIEGYAQWAVRNLPGAGFVGGVALPNGNIPPASLSIPYVNANPGFYSPDSLRAIDHFTCTGFPFSAVTNKTAQYQAGVDVLQDFIGHYSAGSTSDLDSAAFTAAETQNQCLVQGVIQPLQLANQGPSVRYLSPIAASIAPGQLRQAIGEVAQSIGVDVFFTWGGLFSVSAGWFNFNNITSAKPTIDETRLLNIKERKPSQGERWAFFNRLYVVGPDGKPQGPFDNAASIALLGVKIPRTIQGKWLLQLTVDDFLALTTPWQIHPRLEAKQRNLITFTTDREALALDQGSFFLLSWTRGGSAPVYSNTLFHIEQISVDPETLAVDIEAVWVDDVQTTNAYLLDDESLTVRWNGTGGGTLTVTDGDSHIILSVGGFLGNGVVPGDILLMLDTTIALTAFTRYRTIRIANIVSDTVAQVVADLTGDLNFDAPSGVAIAAGHWLIYKGATTYPSAISDPTNYPQGGAMYGKVTDAGGLFSDSSPGNQLLDG